MRLSPDGAKLYVTNFLGDKVTIVDTQTDKIEGEITGFNKIRAISVTADGKTLFAANSGSNDIAVVDIAARARNEWVMLKVRDHGMGVSAEALPNLVKPFFRGDAARTPASERGGGGLGLAIARGLVEAHSGAIDVRNVHGGCVITVRLPLPAP